VRPPHLDDCNLVRDNCVSASDLTHFSYANIHLKRCCLLVFHAHKANLTDVVSWKLRRDNAIDSLHNLVTGIARRSVQG